MQTDTGNLSYQPTQTHLINPNPTKTELLRINNIYTPEDIDRIIRKGSDIIKQYSLTEENVKSLKERGKFFVYEQILTTVDGKTEEQLKKESSSIFVTNIILTTKIKKLIDDNDSLRKKLKNFEVY